MIPSKPKSMDDFIAVFQPDTQLVLQKIRSTIKLAAPDATETINYGIPTFKLNGKNVIHFSAYPKHIGLYPGAQAITDFADDLQPYKTSKGTIQLPLDKPIPYDFIKKITLYRVKTTLR